MSAAGKPGEDRWGFVRRSVGYGSAPECRRESGDRVFGQAAFQDSAIRLVTTNDAWQRAMPAASDDAVSEAIVIGRRFRCAYAATANVSVNRDTEPGCAFRRPAGISESG